jgi:hypothetical protein
MAVTANFETKVEYDEVRVSLRGVRLYKRGELMMTLIPDDNDIRLTSCPGSVTVNVTNGEVTR